MVFPLSSGKHFAGEFCRCLSIPNTVQPERRLNEVLSEMVADSFPKMASVHPKTQRPPPGSRSTALIVMKECTVAAD